MHHGIVTGIRLFALGTLEPMDGRCVLRVEIVAPNPAARGTKTCFRLDAVTLQQGSLP